MRRVLLDTGPLVAFLVRGEADHDWAREQFDRHRPPFLTCEAVLSEACFLVSHSPRGRDKVLELVQRGALQLPFRLADEIDAVAELVARYDKIPMSLADACLVRMAELFKPGVVLTSDSDFRIYRTRAGKALTVLMPGRRA